MNETASGRLPEAPAEPACAKNGGQDFNDMPLSSGANAIADRIASAGVPPYERILAIIEADDAPDATDLTGFTGSAPHPAEIPSITRIGLPSDGPSS